MNYAILPFSHYVSLQNILPAPSAYIVSNYNNMDVVYVLTQRQRGCH